MASNSKTDLANLALSKFTSRRLESYTQESAEGRAVRTIYDNVLRSVLASGNWDFAMKAAELQRSATAMTGRFPYAYTKPNDWIRTYALSDQSDMRSLLRDYRDMGGYIYTDAETLFMEYVAYNDNPQTYPAWFVDLFAVSLAFELHKSLPSSDGAKQMIGEELKQRRMIAQSTEGSMHPPIQIKRGSWSARRFGGGWR